ncbi:MAG: phosphoribosylformylglycinamidine synthase subunit PurL [Candidatus Eisenbacteria bacterium]|nr:phosphoribosylformylglycinamidine synthase subunit PurL [Candidatus Eisenbacteria bacterium]
MPVTGSSDDQLLERLQAEGLSFTLEEAHRVAELVGRDPTVVEAHIFNTMWSEHCSYKSSRTVLSEHLPTEGDDVVLGPGEDAGVVRLCEHDGRTWCVSIAHESHNHPSQVVPNEGAATGIGGIVRDVYCMGADVVGVLDPLRFGDPEGRYAERTREIAHGVVEGIWQYANALGVPNLGGDVYFDAAFDDNCLVNVVALGLVEEARVLRSRAPARAADEPYVLVLVGKPTDPSGFGGATFASRILDEERALEDKYAVQVPDPFLKRMLTVATVEVLELARERGLEIGFKDLGAGGIACVTSELGSAAGLGVHILLDAVPVAEPDMEPAVIACSETQERYCLVVPEAFAPDVLAIYNDRFELPELCHGARAAVVGRVIPEARFVIELGGEVVCDASTEAITTGICYERPAESRPVELEPRTADYDVDVGEALLDVLGSINVCSREHVFHHYDSEVKGNTYVRPGEADASVVAPIPGCRVGVAVAADGNPFMGVVDAYQAGAAAVAESVRNVVATGAVPIALTDCLNFGSPEVPEVFHDFVEAVRGIGDAARRIGLAEPGGAPIPIVSGNVSFYNQSSNGNAIPPSPIVCAVGRVDDIARVVTTGLKGPGHALVLVGRRTGEMGGSALARVAGVDDAGVPRVAFDEERAAMLGVSGLAEGGLLASCHDISDGGLAVAVAEMMLAAAPDAGAGVELDVGAAAGATEPLANEAAARALFCESGGYVLELPGDVSDEALERLRARGAWAVRVGRTIEEPILRLLGLEEETVVERELMRGRFLKRLSEVMR